MDRLPFLIEEISRIGNNKDGGDQADSLSSEVADKDQKIKPIEDYPLPLAVIGVSVL